ncbi:MAG TPA: motility protein MotB [Gammaproteobacteria bacterium]|nr:motility protein MotB [Gammaproteobacteria bacterium]
MAEAQPIIVIKKIKKGGHEGHHGGSWKVAYADFVTAMMAFFLLLWLLSASNDQTLSGIADYFQNPSAIEASGGRSTSMIDLGSNIDVSKGDDNRNRESDSFENYSEKFEQMEMEKLEDLKTELEYLIDNNPDLNKFKDQILIDITRDGLQIQIIDKANRPMFDLASAVLKPYAKRILTEMAPVLSELPNNISISGHTDSRPYIRKDGYSNWELSSDRANAARRHLVASNMPPEKIVRVVGLASKVPLYKDKASDPANRRISIMVLKKRAEDKIYREMGAMQETLPTPVMEKLSRIGEEPKNIATEQEVQNKIRSGTVRRSGVIVRFRGE